MSNRSGEHSFRRKLPQLQAKGVCGETNAVQKHSGPVCAKVVLFQNAINMACQYKKLWMVEQWFRNCKTLLETRPIFHHCDETIRGHVFCSFLALVLKQELESRLAKRGKKLEWANILRDLERVQYVEVARDGKKFLLRSELQGTAGHVFQAVGVAAPPTVQEGGMPE